MTDTNRNKQIAQTFFATFSTGNVPAILDQLADDAVWEVMGKLEGMSGSYTKKNLGPLLLGATALYKAKALRITPTQMIAEGNQVAVEASGFAEMLDGRIYAPDYHYLLTIDDGKVARVREYLDTAHAKDIFFAG
jgi:uncharacterized protein